MARFLRNVIALIIFKFSELINKYAGKFALGVFFASFLYWFIVFHTDISPILTKLDFISTIIQGAVYVIFVGGLFSYLCCYLAGPGSPVVITTDRIVSLLGNDSRVGSVLENKSLKSFRNVKASENNPITPLSHTASHESILIQVSAEHKSAFKDHIQEYLDVLRSSSFWCQQCALWKPPKTHHCRACSKCVPHMDHHCVFFDACVGELNHGYFFFFLALFSIQCVLLEASFWKLYSAQPALFSSDSSSYHPNLVYLLIFVSAAALVIIPFTFYHLFHYFFSQVTFVERKFKQVGITSIGEVQRSQNTISQRFRHLSTPAWLFIRYPLTHERHFHEWQQSLSLYDDHSIMAEITRRHDMFTGSSNVSRFVDQSSVHLKDSCVLLTKVSCHDKSEAEKPELFQLIGDKVRLIRENGMSNRKPKIFDFDATSTEDEDEDEDEDDTDDDSPGSQDYGEISQQKQTFKIFSKFRMLRKENL